MPVNEPNYYKEFALSKAHAAIGVGFAAAFAAANPLVLMVAAAAYAITWIYFPTSHFFVRRIQDRLKLAGEIAQKDELGDFVKRRDGMVARLNGAGQHRYRELSGICAEVSSNNPDNGLINGKLQELLWTYLKMLLMQQGIEAYLSETDGDSIQNSLKQVEADIAALAPEQQRLRASKESLKNTLSLHKKSLSDAQENLQVLNSELSRLEHEIQLLRADAIANNNSDFLSAKINASVESLQESKAILKTMSNADELSFDIPAQASALGFESGDANGQAEVEPVEDVAPKPRARGRVRA